MKPLITLLTLSLSTMLFADANTDWVDARVKAIKPPRIGVNHSAIRSTKNPFLYQYKKQEGDSSQNKKAVNTGPQKAVASKGKQPLQLLAVMNNSALINGVWYRTDETVRGYTLKTVKSGSVLLEKGASKKILFVTNTNKNIKIQVK